MKTTYTRTTFINNGKLREATITICCYAACKYDESITEVRRVEYTGLIAFDIIKGGEEAKKIESVTDESGIDEYHEYLVLHFENGETSIFRNSHCDMFI